MLSDCNRAIATSCAGEDALVMAEKYGTIVNHDVKVRDCRFFSSGVYGRGSRIFVVSGPPLPIYARHCAGLPVAQQIRTPIRTDPPGALRGPLRGATGRPADKSLIRTDPPGALRGPLRGA